MSSDSKEIQPPTVLEPEILDEIQGCMAHLAHEDVATIEQGFGRITNTFCGQLSLYQDLANWDRAMSALQWTTSMLRVATEIQFCMSAFDNQNKFVNPSSELRLWRHAVAASTICLHEICQRKILNKRSKQSPAIQRLNSGSKLCSDPTLRWLRNKLAHSYERIARPGEQDHYDAGVHYDWIHTNIPPLIGHLRKLLMDIMKQLHDCVTFKTGNVVSAGTALDKRYAKKQQGQEVLEAISTSTSDNDDYTIPYDFRETWMGPSISRVPENMKSPVHIIWSDQDTQADAIDSSDSLIASDRSSICNSSSGTRATSVDFEHVYENDLDDAVRTQEALIEELIALVKPQQQPFLRSENGAKRRRLNNIE